MKNETDVKAVMCGRHQLSLHLKPREGTNCSNGGLKVYFRSRSLLPVIFIVVYVNCIYVSISVVKGLHLCSLFNLIRTQCFTILPLIHPLTYTNAIHPCKALAWPLGAILGSMCYSRTLWHVDRGGCQCLHCKIYSCNCLQWFPQYEYACYGYRLT